MSNLCEIAPWRIGVMLAAALVAQPAFAQESTFEAILDMDRDGVKDRAVLELDPDNGLSDLSIYLGAGETKLDGTARPAIVKRGLETGTIVSIDGNDAGWLLLRYGCGGCSNDFATTLTIVYRDGAFLVGGYTYDWDTRYGAGSCDINYLTGMGVMIEGIDGEPTPIKEKFEPLKLADWSDKNLPTVCDI
jgi:hypothetical protein